MYIRMYVSVCSGTRKMLYLCSPPQVRWLKTLIQRHLLRGWRVRLREDTVGTHVQSRSAKVTSK